MDPVLNIKEITSDRAKSKKVTREDNDRKKEIITAQRTNMRMTCAVFMFSKKPRIGAYPSKSEELEV